MAPFLSVLFLAHSWQPLDQTPVHLGRKWGGCCSEVEEGQPAISSVFWIKIVVAMCFGLSVDFAVWFAKTGLFFL